MPRSRSGSPHDLEPTTSPARAPGRVSTSSLSYPPRPAAATDAARASPWRPPSGARELELEPSAGAARTRSRADAPREDDAFWFCNDRLPGSVQRLAFGGGSNDAAAIGAAAARGVATPTAALPHADAIAASFGRHDVGGIRAHTGDGARAAASDMGAAAFATGDHVVLGETSLHTVAHEAAHVVQQRAGVHCKTGDDDRGDAWERHADAVADTVVRGQSAEALLDQLDGPALAVPAPPGAVQRMKVDVDGNYVRMFGTHRDTSNRDGFAAWVAELAAANNTRVLQNLMTALHRTVSTLADHEAIARSLVQRALDKLAPAAQAPADGQQAQLANLPRDQWWKLFIEGDKHRGDRTADQNAMRFDGEQSPGYYAAMSRAFAQYVAQSDGHQLGFADYDAMHVGVTEDMLRSKDGGGFEAVPHKLSAGDVTFPMTRGEFPNPRALEEMRDDRTLGFDPAKADTMRRIAASFSGAERDENRGIRDELIDEHETGAARDTVGTGSRMNKMIAHVYGNQGDPAQYASTVGVSAVASTGQKQLNIVTNRDKGQAEGQVNALFRRYYQRLGAIDLGAGGAAAKRRDKLRAIAQLVRALHVGHYFHDANGRLNTMVLLNRLLVDAGFAPVMMDRTEIFGGAFSENELADAIEAGLTAFAVAVGLHHEELDGGGDDDVPAAEPLPPARHDHDDVKYNESGKVVPPADQLMV